MWLYKQLNTQTYKHGGYTVFYITEPKLRKIEKSKYIDRIVHRWYVNSFMEKYFVHQFINTSYACLKGKGMHKASLDLQKAMLHCKRILGNYYILKMDVKKYFENINKNILYKILERKIKDPKVIWLTKVEFEIELNKQRFQIKGYNNIADFCYRKLNKNDMIFINGKIETNMIINIKSIKKIN